MFTKSSLIVNGVKTDQVCAFVGCSVVKPFKQTVCPVAYKSPLRSAFDFVHESGGKKARAICLPHNSCTAETITPEDKALSSASFIPDD